MDLVEVCALTPETANVNVLDVALSEEQHELFTCRAPLSSFISQVCRR